MATLTLPKTLNYAEQLPALPQAQSWTQTINPTNASFTTTNGIIYFDLPSRGFIDPTSIYLKYTQNYTVGATATNIRACPLYTPIQRLETIIGSQVVESINQYNLIAGHLIMNTQYDIGMKFGNQALFGYNDSTTSNPATNKFDGRTLQINTTNKLPVAGNLVGSLLTSCEKLLPVFAMPSIRIQLTMDSLANILTSTTGVSEPTGGYFTNFELCFSVIDFGPEIENMVMNMGPKLYIKSESFANSSTNLASGSSGNISLVYNQRLASIKSAYIMFCGTNSAYGVNGIFDSFDPSKGSGDINLQCGGVSYPQRPISFLNNKVGIIQELRRAVGSIYDRTNQMSISSYEFFKYEDGSTVTTADDPSKVIIGVSLEKLNTKGALLTGISSQNSPITINLNTNNATNQLYNVYLALNYDAILEIDLMNKQVSIKQ